MTTPESYHFGPFRLDANKRTCRRGEEAIPLSGKAFDLLLLLVRDPGRVLTKAELMAALWPDTVVEESNLTQTIFLLRKVLGDDSGDASYIQTLPRMGYKFVAPVTSGGDILIPAARPAGRAWLWIAAGVIIALGGVALVWRTDFAGTRLSPIRSLAVLPLRDFSGDPAQERFSDSTTEALISSLARIHSLEVISRTSVMRYKGSTKSLPDIAKELGVDAIVEGSVQRSGERMRVSAQLIRAATDKHLWANEYERDVSDVLKLQADIARAIAQEIQAKITPEEMRVLASARSEKINPAAYDEFLLGHYLTWKNAPDDFKSSIAHFERSIQIDPNYAPAYAGLSMAWTRRFAQGYASFAESENAARAAAERALQLDSGLGEAHAAAAHVASVFDWDWASAEKGFRQALEINPNSLETCYCFAIFLNSMGRSQEALAYLERAVKLNPFSTPIQIWFGRSLLHLHRPQEAMSYFKRAKELDPPSNAPLVFLSSALQAAGRTEEALKLVEPLGPTRALAVAYAVVGRRTEALKVVAGLRNPMDLAYAYAALGDSTRAIDAIATALDRRQFQAQFIKVDPSFDALRSDARFQAQVARLKIPDAPR